MSPSGTKLRRQYVKLCDLRDFADPTIGARILEIVPGLEPPKQLRRKYWEYAMLTLFLEDLGLLHEDARILSVGAGIETVLFWLANRVATVVATDIYGEGSFGEYEANRKMLSDPASLSPYPYRESHLDVRHMDARNLEFSDDSFDAVFSLSSIEHFGSRTDIRRSSREMGRVLRPGGGAFIVTECFLGRSAFGSLIVQEAGSRVTGGRLFGATRIFTPRTLVSEIVEPSGLELLQPLDTTPREGSDNVIELNARRRVTSTTGAEYPHIVVRAKRYGVRSQKWTSAALAMSKSKASDTHRP
jgi:SAM-dependent methyltransferase